MNNSNTISIFPFGGCTVNNPLLNLTKRKIVKPIFRDLGFKRTPYSLSPSAILQLHSYCSGELTIPTEICKLIYADYETIPDSRNKNILNGVDLALVEISTPYNILLDGFLLNQNRISELLDDRLVSDDREVLKLPGRWKKALMTQKEETRKETAKKIYPYISGDTKDDDLARNLLLNARCIKAEAEDIASILGELQSRLPAPIGLVMHTFHYLPDGRAVIWPADLSEHVSGVAADLGIPTHDPSELVALHGTEKALASDMRHWQQGFYPVVADHMHEFIQKVLNQSNALRLAS